uniref:Uncharacterized protein n=1 Tax=Panagrolaimus davidi TaxID=227884 RepID=A0A914Q4J3_9BILA
MSVKSIYEIEFASEITVDECFESENENFETPPPQNRKKFIQHVFAAFMIFVCLFIGAILNLSIEFFITTYLL